MRWLFVAVLTLHGLIHLMGPAKAFGWAELSQLQMPISRAVGLVWGLAGLAFLATAAIYMYGLRGWWVLALGAIVLSQGVILASWSDARVGTVANLIILGIVIATILGRTSGSPAEG
jgi:hypothetical protein